MEDRAIVIMAFAWTPTYVDTLPLRDLKIYAKMGQKRLQLMGARF